MNAHEIIEHAEFHGPHLSGMQSDPYMIATLWMKAKAKNGKYYQVQCYAGVVLSKKWNHEILSLARENLRFKLLGFLNKRNGIKGYRGRFQFMDFELGTYPNDSSVERPYYWK